jgi:hypothetical protein
MTSVPNLRQPSSGNNISILWLCIFVICTACFPSKKATKSKSADHTLPKKTGKPNEVPKIDTVVWKEENPSKVKDAPKTEEKDKVVVKPKETEKKTTPTTPGVPKKNTGKLMLPKEDSVYRVVALLPFKANEMDTLSTRLPSGSERFVQYYCGMKMAVQEFENELDKKLLLTVHDIQSNDVSKFVLEKYEKRPPHVIIGPYKSEAVKSSATWAKEHESILISPWVSSSTIAEQNPFYVQAKAGLYAHYKAINDHARKYYPASNIILISKSPEDSKIKFFNDSTQFSANISEQTIKEDELANSQNPILTPFLKEDGPTVFILPFASIKDENYIYHFLRRVSSEKGNKDVIVYGMYKWIELKSDILDYVNTLKIRLSISNYFDNDESNIRAFKKRYFNTYREFPTEEALEGYDLMKYVVRSLKTNLYPFHWYSMGSMGNYLETEFNVSPVFKSSDQNKDPWNADYFENSFVKIVEIRSNRYRVIE